MRNGTDDAADYGRSEDGPSVRLLMMFDVDDLVVRWRVGSVVVRDLWFVVFRGLGTVLFRRLKG